MFDISVNTKRELYSLNHLNKDAIVYCIQENAHYHLRDISRSNKKDGWELVGNKTSTAINVVLGGGDSVVLPEDSDNPNSTGGETDLTRYLLKNSPIVGGTHTKVTYDSNGLVTYGAQAQLASLDYASQGTTITVLHGNASGNPSWGKIVTADVQDGAIIESKLTFSDILLNNSSIDKHGLLPKLNGSDYFHLNGYGIWEQVDAGHSGGMLEEPAITYNGAGSITIAASSINAYHTSGFLGNIYRDSITESVFDITNNIMNYVVAEYNGSEVVYNVRTDLSNVDWSMVTPVYSIFRVDDLYRVLSWDSGGLGLSEKLLIRDIFVRRFERESGLLLSENTGRIISVSSGTAWHGIKRLVYPETTSSTGAIFYYHSGGNWLRSTVTVYNNNQYDNGTNLVVATGNKYLVNWIYRSMDENGQIVFALGNQEYTSLSAAITSTPRVDLPPVFAGVLLLVGRIIVQNGAVIASDIASAFTQIFSSSMVSDHGNLSGLLDDDHIQYALLAGRPSGQTLYGGTAAGGDLTLHSTSSITKGNIFFGDSTYDEVNNRLGLGTLTPQQRFSVVGNIGLSGQIVSSLVTGTAPLAVTSTTLNTNLNADLLDGFHASAFALSTHTHAITDITGLQLALDNKLNTSLKGAINGLAELDSSGKILSSQLPSYVDDVLEYTNLSVFPATGESGKIYIAMDTNLSYRWTGSGYTVISPSLALGETSSTAYRGDRGKIAYDHSQSSHDYLLLIGGTISGQLGSSVSIGTSPFNIVSTTVNTNLNADLLDGQHASAFALSGHTHGSGTLNYIPKFTPDGYTLGNSLIRDDGSTILVLAPLIVSGTGTGGNVAFKVEGRGGFLGSVITDRGWIGNRTDGPSALLESDTYFDTQYQDDGSKPTWRISYNKIPILDISMGSSSQAIISNPYSDASTGGIQFRTGGAGTTFTRMTIAKDGGITITNQLTSILATGVAPFAVTSTTLNTNLNADLLDGKHASDFSLVAHSHAGIYEPVLGNPTVDGYILSSTTSGARSWIASIPNYWSRTGTVLSPINTGDSLELQSLIKFTSGGHIIGAVGVDSIGSDIDISGGNASGSYKGGYVNLLGGSSENGEGGDVTLWGGTSTTGNRGKVYIENLVVSLTSLSSVNGDEYEPNGSNLYIHAGLAYGAGVNGNIYFGNSSTGFLQSKTTETNVIYYNPATGLITYGTAGTSGDYVPIIGASYVQSTGYTTSWNTTNGVTTGAFNTIMGTASAATWLISGTSGGVFRGGIQLLDAGGTMYINTGSSNIVSISGSTITATLNGIATSAGTLASARTIWGQSFNGSANISGAITGATTGAFSGQITSTLEIGTSPFAVTSTTVNTNLNADLLDGQHSSYYQNAGNLSSGYIPAERFATDGSIQYSINPIIPVTNKVRSNLGTPTIAELTMFENEATDKLRFFPVGNISGEYTTDGSVWNTWSLTDEQKRSLVLGYSTGGIPIANGWNSARLTFTASVYVYLNWLYFYNSTNGHTMYVKLEKSYDGSVWETIISNSGTINTWPGHSFIPHSNVPFSPNPTQGVHWKYIRLTFVPTWNVSYPSNNISIQGIQWFGGYPSDRRELYSWDYYKNITFYNDITANRLISAITTGTAPLSVNSTTVNTNLNADLLDGYHQNNFAGCVTGVTDIHTIGGQNLYTFFGSANAPANAPILNTSWVSGIQFTFANNPNYREVLATTLYGDFYRAKEDNGTWESWYKLYDSGNSNLSTVDWAAKNITTAGTLAVTGDSTFTGIVTMPSASTITGAASSYALLQYKTGSSLRWAVGRTSNVESGSNVGSDYYIYRYSDTGGYLGVPFSINRATGLVSCFNGLSTTTGTFTDAVSINNTSSIALSTVTTSSNDIIIGVYSQVSSGGGVPFANSAMNYYAWVQDSGRLDNVGMRIAAYETSTDNNLIGLYIDIASGGGTGKQTALEIVNGDIILSALALGVKTSVLYFDSSTKKVSYGAAAITPVDSTLLHWSTNQYTPYTGYTLGGLYSGTTSPSGTTRLNYGGYLYATKLYSNGYEVAPLESPTFTGTVIASANATVQGSFRADNSVYLTSPDIGTTTSLLYYDASSGKVSYGAIPSVNLTHTSTYLVSNVTMTTANTWYNAVTITLAAGTWLVTGQIMVGKSSSLDTAWSGRIYNYTSSVALVQCEEETNPSGTHIQSHSMTMTIIVDLLTSSSIRLQGRSSEASSYIYATSPTGGLTHVTQIQAIKIA